MRGNSKGDKGKGKGREGEAQPLLSSSPSSSSIPSFPATSITAMEDATDKPRGGEEPGSKEETEVKVETAQAQPLHTLQEYEQLFGVDEDAYEQPTTTRKELWSYYLYYNGSVFLLLIRSIG